MISVLVAFGVFLIGGFAGAACTIIVRRRVSKEFLKGHHETLIYYVTVLTALYGLLIAFVVLALWEQQSESAGNTELEAGVAHTLVLLGGEMAEPHKSRIQRAVKDYVVCVVREEWPALLRKDFKRFSREPDELRRLWAYWMDVEPESERDRILLAEAVRQLDALREARRIRISDGQLTLIPYLWLLLGLGAGLIFISILFIGMEYPPSQIALTAACGGWLMVLLFVVHDLQNPFRGYWEVGPEPYQQALERMVSSSLFVQRSFAESGSRN